MTAMTTELRIALERLVYLKQLRDVVLAAFGPGEPKDRLRASVVSRHVAAKLDREPSPHFCRDIAQAMHAAGWRQVNLGNRMHWKGMRAK